MNFWRLRIPLLNLFKKEENKEPIAKKGWFGSDKKALKAAKSALDKKTVDSIEQNNLHQQEIASLKSSLEVC